MANYSITFKWISDAKRKAADCLSRLVEQLQATSVPINVLSVSNTDRPAFNTKSQTHQQPTPDNFTTPPSITAENSSVPDPIPRSLTADR